MTITTGAQSSTVGTLSIAATTQTTETSLIVTQPSTTVTSTIVVSSETADSRSVVTSVQSTTSSSSAVPVPANETVATVASTSPRRFASAHRPETRASKRTALASAASEKKDTRQPVRSPTVPRSSKTARLAIFTYAGSHSSDSSPRPLRIESPPAAESSTVIATEHEIRSVTLSLISAPTTQQPNSASEPAPQPRTSIGEPAWDEDDDEVIIVSRPETPRVPRRDPTRKPEAASTSSAWVPDPLWQEPSPPEAPSRSPRVHVRELEATSHEFEAAREARAELFRRSIETQKRLARETHSAVLSASSELASLFQTTVSEPTSRASMSPQPKPQSCHGLSVLQLPVAVIVESIRFTFMKDGAPLDISRRVVIQSESMTLLNCRVNFQSLWSLNPLPYARCTRSVNRDCRRRTN